MDRRRVFDLFYNINRIKFGDGEMLPQDRQSEIMKQLHEFKTVKILELSRVLNVTRETIRKD